MPPSTAELREQLTETRRRQDDAANAAGAARERHGRLKGLQALDEASPAEVAEAGALVIAADDETASLAHAVAILEERLRLAEAAERDAEQAELVERHATQLARHRKTVARHDRQLTAVGNLIAELAEFDQALRANRAQLAAALDREGEIREEFEREYQRLVRQAPPGQVPNEDTLNRRQEAALAAMRQDIARQVDEALPLPDPAEMESVRDKHAEILPALAGSELRRILAEGDEFLAPPLLMHDSQASFVGQTSQRVYVDSEVPLAEARFAALVAALRSLRGDATATSIAQLSNGPGPVVSRVRGGF